MAVGPSLMSEELLKQNEENKRKKLKIMAILEKNEKLKNQKILKYNKKLEILNKRQEKRHRNTMYR